MWKYKKRERREKEDDILTVVADLHRRVCARDDEEKPHRNDERFKAQRRESRYNVTKSERYQRQKFALPSAPQHQHNTGRKREKKHNSPESKSGLWWRRVCGRNLQQDWAQEWP